MLSALPNGVGFGFLASFPDKVAHAGVYSVLGASLAHARYHGVPRVPHAVMITIGAVYGATDEWHQSVVPGRVPALDDWIADVAGVALGYGLAWLVVWALSLRREAETTGTTT